LLKITIHVQPTESGWCDCAPAGSDITVVDVTIDPNPIVKGKNVTVTVVSLDSKTFPITSGSVTVTVKYGFLTLINDTFALCDLLQKAHAQDPDVQECPLQPYAKKTITVTHEIPDVFPSGEYSGQAQAIDQNKNVIQCVQFKMDVTEKPPKKDNKVDPVSFVPFAESDFEKI